ncbi:MAG TPA: fibronectin type III domain-containing protein, partial [Candidatus Nitrosotalea sp.]|nr:fibronectin type III domain-containing protein [Candidatus Nitrosotalea sp.]
ASVVSSSQINLSWTAPANNGGSAITGYEIERSTNAGSTWSTISANTASSLTTYSNTGLVASTSYTYRVSAINSVGTGPASNVVSATTSAASNTGKVSITVNSVDLTGTAFSGMYVELHASNGTTLATGYTPMTFTVSSGSAYTIVSSNYQNYVFNHWGDGTTNSSITISPTQNTTLTEYYSTAPTTVTLKVKSVDLSGNPITGLWTVIKSNGVIVAKGYTTLTFTATPGTTYTITMSNYQNYVFNHWSDGSTNPTKTVTPTQNLTVVAYYNS